jgi:CPA2 family monovalent cation:H+ antiporter-2
MHLPPLIVDLALILAVAGVMSFILGKIKQPVVLGYILAGVIVGPYTPPIQLVTDVPGIQTWAELGVIFLMFTLGLEFSFRKLLSVGITATVAAAFEVVFFLIVGFFLGRAFGWSDMDALFLGAMLSISSTTIIIKALDELKFKNHRFAQLIFGILIVEDLFAILMLVALSAIATSETISVLSLMSTALNLILVVGSWFITGYFIVPRIMSYIGKRGNNEMLTLVSIALCLGLVVLATHFGYSPALGAFMMGSILAETEIIHRIEGLMAPLKDLFGAIFFVSIGMLIDPHIMWEYKEVILILCLVTICGKIISTSSGALISGQSFRNSIQVGMGLAQIGEFSFIIASLGVTLKATSPKLYPIAVAVSLVTTFTTPYFIKYSANCASKLETIMPWWFKRAHNKYVDWSERHRARPDKNTDTFPIFFRWLANGIIVTFIFNFNIRKILTLVGFDLSILGEFEKVLGWSVTIAIASPFIWAMVFTSKKNYLKIRKERSFFKAMLVLSFPFMTSIWVSILSAQYFPLKSVLAVMGLLLAIIYFFLYKKLESYYRWIEKMFLETFEKKELHRKSNIPLEKLSPWDSHLVSIEVHPNAYLVNKNLMEAHLRSRFGINIVAIQRGIQVIVSPKPDEKILPRDTLIVLGTDAKLDELRPELEVPVEVTDIYPTSANYRLRHLKLATNSFLTGRTIRESGIREKYRAMVVGIERGHNRTINPETDFIMESQDTIWIVGEIVMLDALADDMG